MEKQKMIRDYSNARKANREIENNILERGFSLMKEQEEYRKNVKKMDKIEKDFIKNR